MKASALATLFVAAAYSVAAPAASPPLIVHEWGTFTSFQDEQGRTIPGINVDDEPVPFFVHRLAVEIFQLGSLPASWSQGAPRCHPDVTMRLETPVLYFYPPAGWESAPFDVRATFNGGWLTEFYPAAAADGVNFPRALDANERGSLQWRQVRLDPAAAALMPETSENVWLAPRKVASAVVVESNAKEAEKYLFYRGVGHLDAPLVVRRTRDTIRISLREGETVLASLPRVWIVEVGMDGHVRHRTLNPTGRTVETAAFIGDAGAARAACRRCVANSRQTLAVDGSVRGRSSRDARDLAAVVLRERRPAGIFRAAANLDRGASAVVDFDTGRHHARHGRARGAGDGSATRADRQVVSASGRVYTVRPPTIVAATPPRSSHPSNGVFFERDRSFEACTRTRSSGARIVISAGAPSDSEPPGDAQNASRDWWTSARPASAAGSARRARDGRATATPPSRARRSRTARDRTRRSSRRSDAARDRSRSRQPSRRRCPPASRRGRRLRAAADSSWCWCRTESERPSASSVNVKWCGATSHVTRTPLPCPCAPRAATRGHSCAPHGTPSRSAPRAGRPARRPRLRRRPGYPRSPSEAA